jgi:hypothetical protein
MFVEQEISKTSLIKSLYFEFAGHSSLVPTPPLVSKILLPAPQDEFSSKNSENFCVKFPARLLNLTVIVNIIEHDTKLVSSLINRRLVAWDMCSPI